MSSSCGFLKECVMQLPRNAVLYQTVCKAIFHLLQLQFSRWHHYSNSSRCLYMLQPFLLLTRDHTQVQSNMLYSQISHMPEQYMITSQVNRGKKNNIVQSCIILDFCLFVSLIHVFSDYRIFCICREPNRTAIYELIFSLVEECW